MDDATVAIPEEIIEVKEMKNTKNGDDDPWAILDVPDEGTIKWSGTFATITFSFSVTIQLCSNF